jgi:hypothetical protein
VAAREEQPTSSTDSNLHLCGDTKSPVQHGDQRPLKSVPGSNGKNQSDADIYRQLLTDRLEGSDLFNQQHLMLLERALREAERLERNRSEGPGS